MKKTLIALAAFAASVASAATVTNSYTLANFTSATAEGYTYGTMALGYTLDASADWTINAQFTMGAKSFNSYGTTALSTNSNAFTSDTGIRVYREAFTETTTERPLITNWFGSGKSNSIYTGTQAGDVITMTLAYVKETGKVSISYTLNRASANLSNYAGEGYTADLGSYAITNLSTSIGYGEAADWSLNNLSVTRTVADTPAVPEPTTATLSLLALAGLASRRRRK